jgi:[CysO sulfur-carrier protein]-S-L-cysteine hydrolase
MRPSVFNDVMAHAQECRPRECCGVLIGKDGEITHAIRAVNLAEGTTRFLLDPKAHIEARRTARAQGLDVVGFYHSHPHSQAYPSPADLAEAAYPECVHLIVGFVEGKPEARLFNYAAGAASELTVLFNS